MALDLEGGEIRMERPGGGTRRIRFSRLRYGLDLGPALRLEIGFVSRLSPAHSGLPSGPVACLVVGLLVAAVCLGGKRPCRPRALVGASILAVAAYEIALWGVEAAWPGGGGLLSAAVLAGSWLRLRT